jgi:hypothetical protein
MERREVEKKEEGQESEDRRGDSTHLGLGVALDMMVLVMLHWNKINMKLAGMWDYRMPQEKDPEEEKRRDERRKRREGRRQRRDDQEQKKQEKAKK